MNNDIKGYKFKIIGVVLIFIICIITSFSILFKNMTLKNKSEQLSETEKNMKDRVNEYFEGKDDKGLSMEDKMAIAMGDDFYKYKDNLKLGDSNNPEFPKEENERFYNELIKKAETADFESILTEIDKKAKQYKFHEDYNWNINNLYYDSTLMIATLDVPVEGKGYIVKNLKDPRMLLIGTLLLPEESRRDVIVDKDSLSPIFDGAVVIKGHQEYAITNEDFEDDYMNTILDKSYSVSKIHKFNFEVELNPLIAYIVEHEDGTLEFFSIKQDGDYDCWYKTINYWIEMDSKIKITN